MYKLKATAITILIILQSAFAPTVSAQTETIEWRIAQTWPKDFPIFGDAVKTMVEQTKILSNGRFNITIVPSQEHGKPFGIFEMVQDGGDYEMGHSASYYWSNRDVNMLFFTTLPFGMTTSEQNAWYYNAGGKELMDSAYAPYGLISRPGGNSGNQMGGWFTKEVKSTEDFKGLKIRIPGIAGDVLASFGAELKNNIAPSNFKTALTSGDVEAVEWVGPSLDMALDLHQSAPFYYTGWHEPASEMQFLINQKAFSSLTPEFKVILETAMKIAAYEAYHSMTHANINNLDRILTDFPDVKIRAFPPNVMRALREATVSKIYDYAIEGTDLTRDIVKSIFNYKDKARVWTRISDQSYLNNADF